MSLQIYKPEPGRELRIVITPEPGEMYRVRVIEAERIELLNYAVQAHRMCAALPDTVMIETLQDGGLVVSQVTP